MENAKSVNSSRTTITELMIPSYANFGGKIHGGILLSLMDKVAYACAAKHAGTYVVTVSVDNVEFKKPVEVGELVSLHASVNYVGRSSLIIGIRVIAENIKSQEVLIRLKFDCSRIDSAYGTTKNHSGRMVSFILRNQIMKN